MNTSPDKQTSNEGDQDRLRISEIFYSLQGESRSVGMPTVFIRLTGCPLRCSYCDTSYAFQGGDRMTMEQILRQVSQYRTEYVTVTGGEPLAQKACTELLWQLCQQGYRVSLETSGALDISGLAACTDIVMDLKTPSSGEEGRNRYSNIEHLQQKDQVKFVISDKNDYLWASRMLHQYNLSNRCEVLFSPVFGVLEAMDLANWILDDQLPVRMQIQLHKYLWGDKPGV